LSFDDTPPHREGRKGTKPPPTALSFLSLNMKVILMIEKIKRRMTRKMMIFLGALILFVAVAF